jgi:hypothetical protein
MHSSFVKQGMADLMHSSSVKQGIADPMHSSSIKQGMTDPDQCNGSYLAPLSDAARVATSRQTLAALNSNCITSMSRSCAAAATKPTHDDGAQYTMIASKQRVGLYVSVWVKSCLRQSVRNVNVSCIGCGLMGYLGNKVSSSHLLQSDIVVLLRFQIYCSIAYDWQSFFFVFFFSRASNDFGLMIGFWWLFLLFAMF